MTASSASESSGSDPFPGLPGAAEVHLWLCRQPSAPEGGLLRSVLSRYLGVPAQELDFVRGSHGKPRLRAAPHPALHPALHPTKPLEFNLSHSGPWQVVAVSGGGAVGVDIEFRDGARDIGKLAHRFYTPCEVKALDGMRGEAALAYFYDCWVLKEALAKAAGETIVATLGAVGFRPVTSGILHWDGEAPTDGHPRHYALFEPEPGWPLALCVEGATPPMVQVFGHVLDSKNASFQGLAKVSTHE